MKYVRLLLFPVVSLFALASSLSSTPIAAQDARWVPAAGNVQLADGTPICAMALANGQYMFSCDGTGAFDLGVPLDANGQITLFSFADGFAPYRVTLGPNNFPYAVFMETAPPSSPLISMSRETACATNNWVRVTGNIQSFRGDPLCAMVLANGQQMFTCGDSLGRYDLTVPADQNGEITIFGFADGFQPYSETGNAPLCDTRYAVINGVEFTYRLVEVDVYGLNCAVQVDAVNTTATTKNATLIFDAFEAPNQFLESTYVNLYLPGNSADSSDPYRTEGIFAESISRGVGCDYIYSWQLNTDILMVF